ncbi:MAG: VTT domain-containing protein [Bacilli bacterium]|nr:VTT domain-containing protein [Bacilli bacterium]
MKNFLKKYKGSIIKTIIVLVAIASIAVGVYFILKACGYTTKEDFLALRDRIGSNIWFWLIIGFLQVIQVIFIPINNQIITIPCALVFNDELWKVWLTSWISIWIATFILYWIGRSGGKFLLRWILNDKEQTEKCTNWLKRGWFFYPLGMLLPLPDDVITTLAGAAKMKVWFVMLCAFFTRGIDTACSVYGWGFLTKFWWGWVLLGIGIALLILLTFLLWKIDKKREKEEKQKLQEVNE